MSKLLLHTCCGPCTIYVQQKLVTDGFAVTGFFYNPNIRPAAEYERRRSTMIDYAALVGLEVLEAANDTELCPGDCETCYRVRLTAAARQAKALGYDYYSTTLLVSPYQNHEQLQQLGQAIGREQGIEFYYDDFRPGFRLGQQQARGMKLYRQKYCGCGVDVRHKELANAQVN